MSFKFSEFNFSMTRRSHRFQIDVDVVAAVTFLSFFLFRTRKVDIIIILMNQMLTKFPLRWAVVVAQLVERSLPIPQVRGSNPVIGKNSYWTFTVNFIEKTKIKRKRSEMGHFKNSFNDHLRTCGNSYKRSMIVFYGSWFVLTFSLTPTLPKMAKYGPCVLKNRPTPASFSFIFGLFKQTLQFLQQ